MSVVECAYRDCRNKSDLRGATLCAQCSRVRCSRCGRCWHELRGDASTLSAKSRTTVRQPRQQTKKSVRKPTLTSINLSQGDLDLLARIRDADDQPEASARQARTVAAHLRSRLAVAKNPDRGRRPDAVAELAHQEPIASLRTKANRLPTVAGPPPKVAGEDSTSRPCIHGMERANCALCNPPDTSDQSKRVITDRRELLVLRPNGTKFFRMRDKPQISRG